MPASEYSKNWYIKNKVRINIRHRQNHLLRTYGISEEEYSLLLSQQKGVCKICLQPGTGPTVRGASSNLCVDHDHATGKIRGLLCRECNAGLGKFKDDVERLRNAANYLNGTQ